ncbi:Calmodulin [Hexamita inflata]|uniref:Calmodulin n=1 Tax=Hexamita inflata TaxID=28002 RepID=A0AA86TLK7_9EUKA|nr:Calmodulin [Hexamita inflata]
MEDIPQELLEDVINEYKEAFQTLDQDRDGFITVADIARLLSSLNQKPTQNELNDLMLTLDPEQSGQISFIQFVKLLVLVNRNFDREESLRSVFLCFDRNGDGNLNSQEIYYVLKAINLNISRAEVEEIVGEFGGQIGFEQFCRAFGRLDM